MIYSLVKKTIGATFLFALFTSCAYAADFARSLISNTDENSTPENFFELGVGTTAYVGSLFNDQDGKEYEAGITFTGSYNWQNFFFDIANKASDPVLLGYTVYNQHNWSFDVIFTGPGSGLRRDENDINVEGINDRDNNSMLGGRLTGYVGENIVQLMLKHDVSRKNDGTIASALIGQNWQVRNINFHGLIGLSFRDAKHNDYYYGVTEQEATDSGFSPYRGKSSLNLDSSVGLTYPISQNWVLRAEAFAGSNFGNTKSPLFSKARHFYTVIGCSIRYVF
ncbi:MipA/OmpV family protein [Pseudoalteromonas tunicata]|uniref:MipA/OmpV family protein n=1 Tax=Pseudoalteromonas tunicata TaxID=314281 RepID=UPI00273DACD5|nr:MipA/OmpV family protein [Pseudoalteromonas tunicata]MDP5212620.1 MipA/OmpV family protein [Pseudoalteromonas tunicata]